MELQPSKEAIRRNRKRDNAERLGKAQDRVQKAGVELLDIAEWFWTTKYGQVTLLVGVAAAVLFGAWLERVTM